MQIIDGRHAIQYSLSNRGIEPDAITKKFQSVTYKNEKNAKQLPCIDVMVGDTDHQYYHHGTFFVLVGSEQIARCGTIEVEADCVLKCRNILKLKQTVS
eukprot:scaffold1616_cov100-Skeletonema_dohrnii-CCMP3373.AAC.3